MATKDLLIPQRQRVRRELGISNKDIVRDIEIVRNWIKTQQHLPEIPNDNMIEVFLVNNKFSIERTKEKLDMYYTIENLMPELYKNRHPRLPHMRKADKMAICCLLPKLSKELYRVHIMKFMGDPEFFDFSTVAQQQLNLLEVRVQEDLALGDVYICDYEFLKMGHVLKMTPLSIKKIATIWEKVFSNRIKGIHVINYPPYVDVLVNICRATMKPKLVQRLHLHSSVKELHQHISKDILPSDYDGDEKSLSELNDLWKIKFEEYNDRFDRLEKMTVNESLRPEPLDNDEILGFHGNFKTLDVD